MQPELGVKLGPLSLKNPVLTASGTFGYGGEYAPFIDLNRLGAIIVKGISLYPREGNPGPRIIETPSGMLNAIGLENVGAESFVRDKLPFLRRCDAKVIVNIYGETIDEFRETVSYLSRHEGIHAVEINISCPNVHKGGVAFGTDPEMSYNVARAVRAETNLPLITKLTPNVTDIAEIALAAQAGGSDAVSLINTIKGMSVDVRERVPHLRHVTGGLSGPAIRPVALRMVWEVVKKVSIPVIGIGGIADAEDALAFLIAGARAVEIGTANFVNPETTTDIIEGIRQYLEKNRIKDVNEIIGSLRV